MSVSYNGLWKLLIDKNMKKVDLINNLGISSSTIAKMTKGEKVSMNILEKICDELDCDFGDIIHYEKNKDGGNNELQCRHGVSGICICRDETDSRTYGSRNVEESASEKSKATKAVTKYTKQLTEMKIYDEAIAHVAHHRIEIDLDDGVKGKLCEIPRCGSSTGR